MAASGAALNAENPTNLNQQNIMSKVAGQPVLLRRNAGGRWNLMTKNLERVGGKTA